MPTDPPSTPSVWIARLITPLRDNFLNVSFWLGLTMGFPLEHFLWEKVWPFRLLTAWLDLGH